MRSAMHGRGILPVLIACVLVLSLFAAPAFAESGQDTLQVASATPENVVFSPDGYAGLNIKSLGNGSYKATWPETENADYYYLVVCAKGFVADENGNQQSSVDWVSSLWSKYAKVQDITEKMLLIIGEYDGVIWYRAETNELEYEPGETLTKLVYAQNDVPYDESDSAGASTVAKTRMATTVENQFVFYVPSGIDDELKPIGFITVTPGDPVNLRSGDDTSAPVVGKAAAGTVMICFGSTPKGWPVVLTDDGILACLTPSRCEFEELGFDWDELMSSLSDVEASGDEAGDPSPAP